MIGFGKTQNETQAGFFLVSEKQQLPQHYLIFYSLCFTIWKENLRLLGEGFNALDNILSPLYPTVMSAL